MKSLRRIEDVHAKPSVVQCARRFRTRRDVGQAMMPSLVQARAGPASAPPGVYAPLAVEWSVDMVVVKKARTRRARGRSESLVSVAIDPRLGSRAAAKRFVNRIPLGMG